MVSAAVTLEPLSKSTSLMVWKSNSFRASGQTQALVELSTADVRPIQELDLSGRAYVGPDRVGGG